MIRLFRDWNGEFTLATIKPPPPFLIFPFLSLPFSSSFHYLFLCSIHPLNPSLETDISSSSPVKLAWTCNTTPASPWAEAVGGGGCGSVWRRVAPRQRAWSLPCLYLAVLRVTGVGSVRRSWWRSSKRVVLHRWEGWSRW